MPGSKSYEESVAQRMALYVEAAHGAPIKAYINIGGGTTSVGTRVGKRLFKPGLNTDVPNGAGEIDSVMLRFATEGTPVIHLVRINELAEEYGLPIAPLSMPTVGEGRVFLSAGYNPYLATGALVLIIACMIAFIRMDLGVRILQGGQRDRDRGTPQPMV